MKSLRQAVKMVLCMTILTGVIYPTVVTFIAKYTSPQQASCDFITLNDTIIGARSIGQKFESDRFFWPRPSACDYNALLSSGSNLSPTSKTLKARIEARKAQIGTPHIPAELLYQSGSGLDPHISISTALYQVPRIANARKFDTQLLKNLIETYSEGDYINVLILNKALEEITK